MITTFSRIAMNKEQTRIPCDSDDIPRVRAVIATTVYASVLEGKISLHSTFVTCINKTWLSVEVPLY